jgi:hypothetical protein
MYPSITEKTVSEIISIYSKYWSKKKEEIPFRLTLTNTIDNFSYWNNIKSICTGSLKIAADFAIRITCSGITQCGVERTFSRTKWLLGTRRFRLTHESLKDLLVLRDIQ